MSKVGRKPIKVPPGVTVVQNGDLISVTGKLGVNEVRIETGVTFSMKESVIELSVADGPDKQTLANWGTTGAHLRNAILGVTEGFQKSLEIQGVGYKAAQAGEQIDLELGFSHTVHFPIPKGITTEIDTKKNTILISGIDRQLVGHVTAKIRALKKPEPYNGKGIRYANEVVRRKSGKKVVGT